MVVASKPWYIALHHSTMTNTTTMARVMAIPADELGGLLEGRLPPRRRSCATAMLGCIPERPQGLPRKIKSCDAATSWRVHAGTDDRHSKFAMRP